MFFQLAYTDPMTLYGVHAIYWVTDSLRVAAET